MKRILFVMILMSPYYSVFKKHMEHFLLLFTFFQNEPH